MSYSITNDKVAHTNNLKELIIKQHLVDQLA